MRGVLHEGHASRPLHEKVTVVMATIITPRAGKAISKDAAFDVFAKGLVNEYKALRCDGRPARRTGRRWRVHARSQSVLQWFCKQRARRVARVVELGLGARLTSPVRKRMRWTSGSGHPAVPA